MAVDICEDPSIWIDPPHEEEDCDCCSVLERRVNELEVSKQDNLTPGSGITIDQNNVISATGGTVELFVPVTTLPDPAEANEHLIYLTARDGGGMDEWNVIEEDGVKVWNKFGDAEVNITKATLLEILEVEEITNTITDTDGNTVTEHLLGRIETTPIPVRIASESAGSISVFGGEFPVNTDRTVTEGSVLRVTFTGGRFTNNIEGTSTLINGTGDAEVTVTMGANTFNVEEPWLEGWIIQYVMYGDPQTTCEFALNRDDAVFNYQTMSIDVLTWGGA